MIERSVKNKVSDYEVQESFIPSRQGVVFKTSKLLEHDAYFQWSPSPVRQQLRNSDIPKSIENLAGKRFSSPFAFGQKRYTV